MITAAEATQIILANATDYGTELTPFAEAMGRVLAEDIIADRDLPPYDRSTMDGIAISDTAFENGIRSFRIKATMAAGDAPVEIDKSDECLELMTGCAVPVSTGTVVRYEDIDIKDGVATVNVHELKKEQNVHLKGKDKKLGDVLVTAPQYIDAAIAGIAASVGQSMLPVKKLPRVVVISTGNELVDVGAQPSQYQVRRSNSYTVHAALQEYAIQATVLHIADDPVATKEKIQECLQQYDVILLSGGISMGKFDYVPQALEELNVAKLFHGVQQRPGKPFWFGRHADGVLVFAFPGNPVSTFMCLHRYFIPWLKASLEIQNSKLKSQKPLYAILDADVTFVPALQYFVQVKLRINDEGHLLATPVEGNGSGDHQNLLSTDAFMELPLEKSNFSKGEVYRIWPFKKVV